MRLIAIFNRPEGETTVRGILSIWQTKINYGAGQVLRSLGFALMLPIPIYGRYESWERGAIYKGWRVPVLGLRIGFVCGDKKRPMINARVWLHALGKQHVIATHEQIQDGMVI